MLSTVHVHVHAHVDRTSIATAKHLYDPPASIASCLLMFQGVTVEVSRPESLLAASCMLKIFAIKLVELRRTMQSVPLSTSGTEILV